jgi:aspartate kinase
MKVYKFGGASVKDAEAVINVGSIIDQFGTNPLVVVISAMGKTTNALEQVMQAWWDGEDYSAKIEPVRQYHYDILSGLFPDKKNVIWDDIANLFLALDLFLARPLERNYDLVYDEVVSFGELFSTKIVSAYLNMVGLRNKWVEVRNFVITDSLYREARVDWDVTSSLISRAIPAMAADGPVITQGFIGSNLENLTTTLGREGSDFTAAIFAYALNAEELVIWKDVPGIMNADPKKFPSPVKYDKLSYHEAVEMTYYGASVLHPKTIKPLQNKNIPLNVRSFLDPSAEGTWIRADYKVNRDVPIIILKENQVLLSLSAKDYSFIAEENIEKIFAEVVRCGIKVNVMNNSAISFQVCIDGSGQKLHNFIDALEAEFFIISKPAMELLTIKHYKENMLADMLANRAIMLEVRSGDTVQFVLER